MSNPLLVPPRTEEVFLYRPGVEQTLEGLRLQLDQLAVDIEEEEANQDAPGASPRGRMNKPSALRKLIEESEKVAAEYDRLAQEARDNRVRLLFQEPTSDQYMALRDKHPPRKNMALDQMQGHNTETFPPALVRLCMVEPDVTDEQWDEFRHGRPADPDDPAG